MPSEDEINDVLKKAEEKLQVPAGLLKRIYEIEDEFKRFKTHRNQARERIQSLISASLPQDSDELAEFTKEDEVD